jgi:N-acetylglucosamine-6-sulfatase
MTEVIQDRALAFIEEKAVAKAPFFAYIAPHAPHTRATPTPDTEGYFFDWKAPRLPSCTGLALAF